jgi:hypothetical protein
LPSWFFSSGASWAAQILSDGSAARQLRALFLNDVSESGHSLSFDSCL